MEFNKNTLIKFLEKNGKDVKVDNAGHIYVEVDNLKEFLTKLKVRQVDAFRLMCVNGYEDKRTNSFYVLYHFTNPYLILTVKKRFDIGIKEINSISDIFCEAVIFEEEFAEKFGINVKGIPSTGLFRKEKDIPKEKSKICVVNIGPQHPALIEPENFVVEVEGEKVVKAEINLGYVHRGIETLTLSKNYVQNIYLMERICGICSGVHTSTYALCVEHAMNVDIPKRAKYIRSVILELERLHSHMLWLGIFSYEMGLDTMFQYVFKTREYVLDILEKITGNRVNYSVIKIGGVRRDINKEVAEVIKKRCKEIKKDVSQWQDVFSTDDAILSRIEGVGKVKRETAKTYATGPNLRACDVKEDRRQDGYLAYEDINFNVVVEKGCDVLASTLVRIREMIESCEILEELIEKMPSGDYKGNVNPIMVRVNDNVEQCFRCEAPRGEVFYYLRGNGTDKPEKIKIRTPTLMNYQLLPAMLIGSDIASIPVIISSVDPCFSCCERIAIIKDGKVEKMTIEELKKYGDR